METRNSGSGKKKMNKDTEELSVKGSDATRREPADQTMIRQETMNQVFPVVTDQGIVQTRDEAGNSKGISRKIRKRDGGSRESCIRPRDGYGRKNDKRGDVDHKI